MRVALVSTLIMLSFQVNSQNLVKGTVFDSKEHIKVPGAKILELGTSNITRSDLNGQFQLNTLSDTSTLIISFVGYSYKEFTISSDTTLLVDMFYDLYNTRWFSFGTSYGTLNQVFGFQLSNAADEEPFIHFEEFQDNFIVKLNGQTDFKNNYSYSGELGFSLKRFVGRTTLKYDRINFKDPELFLTDFNLTSRIRYVHNTGLLFRAGYQKLTDRENYGLGLGLEQVFQNFFHFGINSRYYFDYFHHEVYSQLVIPSKNLLTFRTVYNRINRTDLLTIGLNYAFVRTSP